MPEHAPTTTAPAATPPALAGEHATDGLVQVWKELTARGFAINEPVPGEWEQCHIHLTGAHAEIDVLDSGELLFEFMPLPRGSVPVDATARMVLELLAAPVPAHLPTRYLAGYHHMKAAGWLLREAGMCLRLVTEHPLDYAEAFSYLEVTGPAHRERGHARVTDEGGNVLWLCHFARPGSPLPGLAPADMAATIAAAAAPHRPLSPAASPALSLPPLATAMMTGHALSPGEAEQLAGQVDAVAQGKAAQPGRG
jgi:hypothetical protein